MTIEPNWHPVLVHFVVAFLLTAPVLYAAMLVMPKGAASKTSLQSAGDWMLALGALFAALAVAAGLYAYATVTHDNASHAAMTSHRNIALPTAALFAILGVWRFFRRGASPSPVFVAAALAAAALVAATAWKGGALVYHHGLGVASLPHAGDMDHHKQGDGGSDHDRDHHGAEAGGHDHDEAGPAPAPAAANSPAGTVDAFSSALRASDATAIRRLLSPSVLVAESGEVQRSLEEYEQHHMGADMVFMSGVASTLKSRQEYVSAEMAVIVSEYEMEGSFLTRPVHSQTTETMALSKQGDQWRIEHIHWSSAPVAGEHEH